MYTVTKHYPKGTRIISVDDTQDRAIHRAGYAARVDAFCGWDGFYRVTGPQGFIHAYSVIGGIIQDHVTAEIPREHQ